MKLDKRQARKCTVINASPTQIISEGAHTIKRCLAKEDGSETGIVSIDLVCRYHSVTRAAHRNRILRFVRYGCTGKTPVPSSPQTCELTAVILTAVNRIETVNFSRITASYGYTGACSVIS